MTTTNVLDDIEIERERRLRGLSEPDPHARVLWRRALAALASDLERQKLLLAFQFAKEIKYHHIGLTSEVYFSHPLRVAAICLLSRPDQGSEVGVLGILHNVLEVSDVSADLLAEIFGRTISDQVVALTVNRNIQWDHAYKTNYYRNLMAGPRITRAVKIVDKLDNLFTLGLNADEEVKTRYLSEIEDFVLPMVEATIPELLAYMSDLVSNCRTIGFIRNPVASSVKGSI